MFTTRQTNNWICQELRGTTSAPADEKTSLIEEQASFFPFEVPEQSILQPTKSIITHLFCLFHAVFGSLVRDTWQKQLLNIVDGTR
jgi:hypothetical protein